MKLQAFPKDPLFWDFELPLQGTYYPMGFSLEIVTNSAEVLVAAEESWGLFRKVFSELPLHIRIGVLPGSSDKCPSSPTSRGQGDLITTVADGENYVALDLRQGFAFGWLTDATVQNRAYLRYYFLESTAWLLLEGLYLTSVHGACMQLDGRGVLLCGDGGAGKSSLAYACAKNGWTFVTDDSSCLLRKRGARLVTGNPYQMRFPDSATDLFPELTHQPVSQRLSGELSIELATAAVPEIAVTSECLIDYLVFLNRLEPEPEGLYQFPRSKALRWLEEVVCWGNKHIREEHKAALRELAAAEAFEMRYTSMDSALGMLENLIRNGPSIAKKDLATAVGRENG